jgi:uncharacterized OsmC-like protein
MTATVEYTGQLRCALTHALSGVQILTDAPPDNHGKGEAFSPTDLCAASLAACMLTVMGIRVRERGISIDGARAEVTKVMAADQALFEHIAHTCPVALSLHPDIEQSVVFVWQDSDDA